MTGSEADSGAKQIAEGWRDVCMSLCKRHDNPEPLPPLAGFLLEFCAIKRDSGGYVYSFADGDGGGVAHLLA